MDKQTFFQWLDEYFAQSEELSQVKAAKIMGISRNTLRKRIEQGIIPATETGKIKKQTAYNYTNERIYS